MPIPAALAAAAMTFTLTKGPMIIDLPGFSVRDISPPIFDEDSSVWHMYATVVNHSFGDGGYHGEIGHFFTNRSVSDPWTFDGIVIPRGAPGAWDCTGVFTPGVTKDGNEWVVFFAGVGAGYDKKTGKNFSQWQGMATATNPFGPFVKSSSNPVIRSAVGPPPMERVFGDRSCEAAFLVPRTTVEENDIDHSQVSTAEACQAACCAEPRCQAFTFTTWEPRAAKNCPQGSPCCWLKSAGGTARENINCTSGWRNANPPNGSWDFIRLGNARPLVTATGQRLLMAKGVALNFTALMNIYLPQGGATPSTSWDPPYVEHAGNPIFHPTPQYPTGFENEEVFAGPDGLLHLIGNMHGPAGNPHFVAAPNSSLLDWHLLEVLQDLYEPAPIAHGILGADLQPPLGFTYFEENGKGTVKVWFESIEWKPRN